MSDFMSFRRMVTPLVIQVLFVLGCIAALLGGIGLFSSGITQNHRSEAVLGVLVFFFGPLAVRLYSEAMIVIFRINETLTDLRDLAIRAAEKASETAD